MAGRYPIPAQSSRPAAQYAGMQPVSNAYPNQQNAHEQQQTTPNPYQRSTHIAPTTAPSGIPPPQHQMQHNQQQRGSTLHPPARPLQNGMNPQSQQGNPSQNLRPDPSVVMQQSRIYPPSMQQQQQQRPIHQAQPHPSHMQQLPNTGVVSHSAQRPMYPVQPAPMPPPPQQQQQQQPQLQQQ